MTNKIKQKPTDLHTIGATRVFACWYVSSKPILVTKTNICLQHPVTWCYKKKTIIWIQWDVFRTCDVLFYCRKYRRFSIFNSRSVTAILSDASRDLRFNIRNIKTVTWKIWFMSVLHVVLFPPILQTERLFCYCQTPSRHGTVQFTLFLNCVLCLQSLNGILCISKATRRKF